MPAKKRARSRPSRKVTYTSYTSKSNQTFLLIVLAAFVIFASIYYFIRPMSSPAPTPQPTEVIQQVVDNTLWKTYKHPSYKYEFKYPTSYKLKVYKNDSIEAGLNSERDNGELFSVNIQKGSLEEYLKTATIGAIVKPNTVVFNEITASKIIEKDVRQDGLDFYSLRVLFEKDGKLYILQGQLNSHDEQKIQEFTDTVNTILSTFKFLD